MRPAVASGPVVSYTAVSPLPALWLAVYSLLRYLSGHPGRMLSAIVLYGARKFLNPCPMQNLSRGRQGVSAEPSYTMVRSRRSETNPLMNRHTYHQACHDSVTDSK